MVRHPVTGATLPGGVVARAELLAFVKHDCPACDQLLPALDAAGVRVVSQSSPDETAAQAERLHLSRVPEIDDDLMLSERFDPVAVPAVVLLVDGEECDRVEGIQRARLEELAAAAGAMLPLDGLPDHRPGCASRTRDPEVAPWLAVRRARRDGRLQSRSLVVGALEDPFDALHERGLTDGLPVVPPTPERVVAMLEHSSRHPQELVGRVPPYGGAATVEKVAVNAVMAGCAGRELPIVLAAVEAACVDEFALHGVLATTYPAGPVVVVSGPLAAQAGMNAAVNVLGQGNRANLAVGRALQLVVRNVGGGRPGVEDRAAHGQAGKLGCSFAERLDEDAPWPGLAHSRLSLAPGETGVTVAALEAPRVAVDQTVREPERLCASLADALEAIAAPTERGVVDALVLVGPEHGRLFREAGWSRSHVQQHLYDLTREPTPKFAAPDRILLAYAGGEAGLFSMVFGGWIAGEIGSVPVTRSVEPWR